MTNSKQAHLDSIQSIKSEFLAVLEGMAYCLDWKQDESEWSARELVYHMPVSYTHLTLPTKA